MTQNEASLFNLPPPIPGRSLRQPVVISISPLEESVFSLHFCITFYRMSENKLNLCKNTQLNISAIIMVCVACSDNRETR